MKKLFIIILFSDCLFKAAAQVSPDSLTSKLLQEVVVTGQFEAQSLKQSVYQVRTISSEIIQMRNATNVQNILSTELGIRFSNDPVLGTADISLMGMAGQDVKILLDGVPLLDRGATRESLNQIDVNTIKRIEIIEGPMSVVYGTDALAGVINIITKKNGDAGASGLSLGARVLEETAGKEYQPFNGKGVHNENVNLEWQGKTWNAGGGITRNNFGGWQGNLTGRAKQWLPKDQWLGNGSVGFTQDDFNAWYRLNYLNETITTLGDAYTDGSRQKAIDKDYITDRFTHQAQADWRLNEKWNLNFITSYQDYARRTLTTTLDLESGDRRLFVQAGSQDKAQFTSGVIRGIALYKISSKVSLQGGADVNLNKGFGERIDGTREINDYALFVSGEITATPAIRIRPGLRFIYNSVYDAPPVIPSLNAKFILNDNLDLRLSYGYGFRAPALRELYFYFFDASHSIKGNPNLKAEYSNSFSGSLVWQAYTSSTIRVKSTLGGFYNAFDNMITIGVDPENSQINTYINVYKYRTAGVTLNNSLSWKAFKGSLGFSYIGVYNQLSENSDLPALMYTPEVNTTLAYSFNKTGTTVSLFYKFTGKRSNYQTVTVNSEQVVTLAARASFQWADITATQKITKYLNLSAGVKNLFDVTSIQNTSQDTGGAHSAGGPVPMSYGRSYFAGLTFKL